MWVRTLNADMFSNTEYDTIEPPLLRALANALRIFKQFAAAEAVRSSEQKTENQVNGIGTMRELGQGITAPMMGIHLGRSDLWPMSH